MTSAIPVNKPKAKPAVKKAAPVSEDLSLQEQVEALKAQLAEAQQSGGNNAGMKSVVKERTELPDGTIKVDY